MPHLPILKLPRVQIEANHFYFFYNLLLCTLWVPTQIDFFAKKSLSLLFLTLPLMNQRVMKTFQSVIFWIIFCNHQQLIMLLWYAHLFLQPAICLFNHFTVMIFILLYYYSGYNISKCSSNNLNIRARLTLQRNCLWCYG